MISIIAAVGNNGVIGRKNDLPWNIPEDLKRFKQMTDGKIVIMGKRTFDSIYSRLGKPLPNRRNIVLSLEPFEAPEGVEVRDSLNKALEEFKDEEAFIIGGAQIYKAAIRRINVMYLTWIDVDVPDGDAFFPPVRQGDWTVESQEQGGKNFQFIKLVRKNIQS